MPPQLFAADDKFADVVAALEARGWRRLPFVGCPKFDLKWTNYAKIAWARVTPQQLVNHVQHAVLFSQKDQLTQLLYAQAARGDGGQLHVDRCFPRTFDLSQPGDFFLLKCWFLYSQAVAVLKRSLSESQEVHGAQVDAAVRLVRVVLAGDDDFFKCWRKEEETGALVAGEEADEWLRLLTSDSGLEKAPLDCERRQEVEGVLSELKRRDPQFHAVWSVDSNVWICKPSNLSQGRGIELCSSFQGLVEITLPGGGNDEEMGVRAGNSVSSGVKWVVQKYIERPLLVQNGRKFDIRQWVLITGIEPKPTAFWFDRSYLRFCSRKFELKRLQDRFTHLSNYSVQQYFVPEETADEDQRGSETTIGDENFDDFEPMWSSEKFQDTLRHEHGRDVWTETILPQMQNTARLSLNAVFPKLKVVGRGFEWLGFDFLIDESHRVWLLEVNVSPDVSHSTDVTAQLAPKATADALNVLLDPESSRSPDNEWLPFSLELHQ
ncbi:hypothetical protein PHYPSEUDO_002435 [Phytophthora pseudosyringae]|uniref:Tubulin-tyrosine ligase family n=1 Tax=Phytophthora pseudosyringae TaxID=221518 RepID=A0A8T1VTU8_9STRA|nr:hypothetical protein PHYPSEUDO_002435 [Phytophthora pseudosyringae]